MRLSPHCLEAPHTPVIAQRWPPRLRRNLLFFHRPLEYLWPSPKLRHRICLLCTREPELPAIATQPDRLSNLLNSLSGRCVPLRNQSFLTRWLLKESSQHKESQPLFFWLSLSPAYHR